MSFMKRDWHKCYLCNRFGLLDIYLCLLKLDLFRLCLCKLELLGL